MPDIVSKSASRSFEASYAACHAPRSAMAGSLVGLPSTPGGSGNRSFWQPDRFRSDAIGLPEARSEVAGVAADLLEHLDEALVGGDPGEHEVVELRRRLLRQPLPLGRDAGERAPAVLGVRHALDEALPLQPVDGVGDRRRV